MINTADGPIPGDEVQVRFDVDGRPLAVRHDGTIWPLDPDTESSHWFSREDWSNAEISAAAGAGDVLSVEKWRVQVRLISTSALLTFTLRRDPLSTRWLLESIADSY